MPQSGALLAQTLELARLTGGTLDPTAYTAVKAWGFADGNYRIPTCGGAGAAEGRHRLHPGGAQRGRQPGPPGPGAAAGLRRHGQGLGRRPAAAAAASRRGSRSALLDLGQSSIAAVGTKPDGSPWRIAVQVPAGDNGDYVGILELERPLYGHLRQLPAVF